MDAIKSTRSSRRGKGRSKKVTVPVSSEHDGGVHETSWHHVRLHEEAVSGPHRPALSRLSSQQEIRTGN